MNRGRRSRGFGRGLPNPRSQSTSETGAPRNIGISAGSRGRGGYRGSRDSSDRRGSREGRDSIAGFNRSGQVHNNEEMREGSIFERNAGERNNGYHSQGRQARSGQRDTLPRAIGYGLLKKWAEMEDAGQLVLYMSNQKQQIQTFLNQATIRTDWLTLFVTSLAHAITAQHQRESIKQILNSLCSSSFFQHVATYIEEKQLLEVNWADAVEFYTFIINIIEEILNKLPQFAVKCVTGSSTLLNAAPNFKSIQSNQTLLDTITIFSKKAKEVYIQENEKEKNAKSFGNCESDKPTDNFIDLSVVPTSHDLSADAKPFLRSAKIKGEYDDVEHYLDVQFRLMRQDFVLPLREGIIDFKKNGCKKNYHNSDLRLYFDVHIVGIVYKDGIDHVLQFDISKLKKVKWDLSKRLIFGSLLCLSKDNFETVFFATVANRDPKNLAKGMVNVNFKTRLDEVFNSSTSDEFIMAETTAYFESYCHVLEGLKEMSKTLPLQDYIIKCKKDIRPPSYLLPSQGFHGIPTYDLLALMKNKMSINVAVLTTIRWPDFQNMCLNKSQRDAAIMALTKEVAVIQGPPGTGKTYVGLKVMQVLIQNMNIISGMDELNNVPILVVCYTNHALDQFLEGVLEFCSEGIIRVGGKSSSEKLAQFNLKNLKLKARRDKSFSNLSVRNSIYDSRKMLENISLEIKDLKQNLDSLEADVVSPRNMKDVMKDSHYLSLMKETSLTSYIKNNKLIRNWLNAAKTPATLVPQMIQQKLTNLVLQWNNVSEETKLAENMTIIQRTNVYHYFLDVYKKTNYKNKLIYQSQGYGNAVIANRIAEIDHFLQISSVKILPDQELEVVINRKRFEKMISFIRSSNRHMEVPQGSIVKTWLLGLHKGLNSQLDDVQMLTNALSGEFNTEVFDDYDDDDASRQMQNDRMIDDDDDDDDYAFSSKNMLSTDNISYILQRAATLGIDESILEEDGNKQNSAGQWTNVSYAKPLTLNRFVKKLKTIAPMTDEMESSVENIWELDFDKRFSLYNLWIQRYKENLTRVMLELVERYKSTLNVKQEAQTEDTLCLLRSAKVIGMTTTGAAKHRAVLQSLGCRIIVVEEAAEVLESHIVTALNKNCKHLILIGDHQQLRPSPTVYVLAKEFGLEISLFERFINNKVPHVLLKEQHRMRPEISKIMHHIYSDLEDHNSVMNYESIRGVAKNIFFIQHEQNEEHVDDSRSKANIFEANYLVALCQYLLNQGYSESQITILATYAGQVFAIRKIMRDTNFNHRVRVTAVDNFQGEENEIILLSLVRSNSENSVGFLKVDNRVCVALSRARNGLFITGNFDLLASQSKLWKNIVATVKQEQAFGSGLPVMCPNHTEFKQIMTCAEDFKKCPEGGCGRDCEYKLKCGHICGRKCHGYDLQHEDYQCRKVCGKKCVNGHPCNKKCYQDCGDCLVKVEKTITDCGHKDEVPCSVPPMLAECSQKCLSLLECEHCCSGKCGKCRKNRKHEKCVVPITYAWPCGHSATVPCYMKPTIYPCQKACATVLDCGHKCTGFCGDCLQGAVHVACEAKCEKLLPCGHTCPSYCGAPCLPCTEVCPSECRHGSCRRAKPAPLCSHVCAPCQEPCLIKCYHNKCTKLCSETCSFDKCLQKCQRKLKCEHFCSGLCGELCVCAKCETILNVPVGKNIASEVLAHDKTKNKNSAHKSTFVPTDAQADHNETELTEKDNENVTKLTEEKNNDETELTEKTNKKKEKKKRVIIKIPSCGHNFYLEELDAFIFSFDDTNGSSYIPCPHCSKPIMKCMRYEDINQSRYEKREKEKIKLNSLTMIKKTHITDLRSSQLLLEDSVFMTGFRTIDCTKIKHISEMLAVSFKFKCAFMLSEIISLLESSLSSMQLFRAHKDAVLAIKNRLTNQLKLEFTTELLRCFWEHYITHLENLASQYNIDIPQAMKDRVKETQVDMKSLKPDNSFLLRAKGVADILRRRISENTTLETVKAKCLLLEQASTRTLKVMESHDEEMLCDLINDRQGISSRARYSMPSFEDGKSTLLARFLAEDSSRNTTNPLEVVHSRPSIPFRSALTTNRTLLDSLRKKTSTMRPVPQKKSLHTKATPGADLIDFSSNPGSTNLISFESDSDLSDVTYPDIFDNSSDSN